MTGKDVYLQMTWSWPDKTLNILCSYCLQWNISQSKFRNHYFLFLFAFSILSQLFLIWGCIYKQFFCHPFFLYIYFEIDWLIDWLIRMLSVMLVVYWSPFIDTRKGHLQTEVGSLHCRGVCWRKLWIALVCIRMVSSWFYGMSSVLLKYNVCHDGWTYTEGATWVIFRDDIMDLRVQDSDLSQPVWHKQAHFSSENVKISY